jgi:hypothetical protein
MGDAISALVELVDAYHRGAPEPELHQLHARALEAVEFAGELALAPDHEPEPEAVAA